MAYFGSKLFVICCRTFFDGYGLFVHFRWVFKGIGGIWYQFTLEYFDLFAHLGLVTCITSPVWTNLMILGRAAMPG